MRRLRPFLLGTLLAAACTPQPPAGSGNWIASHPYVCNDGTRLTINWGADELEAVFASDRWRLRRAVSASGARYAGNGREVWEHQGEVRVTSGAHSRTCTAIGD